jgi:hypothetical protein
MDQVDSLQTAVRTIHGRTFHRMEYSPGMTTLVIIFNLIVLVRFGADIYLLFYLQAGGVAALDLAQVFGGLFLFAGCYLCSSAPMQGYKLHAFLPEAAMIFRTGKGRRLLRLLKLRTLLYRPLGFVMSAILFVVLIIFSVLYPGKLGGIPWFSFAAASVLSVGGYCGLTFLSARLRLPEFESRLIEIIFLFILAFANADFVPVNGTVMLLLYYHPLPLYQPVFFILLLSGVFAVCMLMLFIFRLGELIYSRRLRGGPSPVHDENKKQAAPALLLRLYFKFISVKYWIAVFFVSYLIMINKKMNMEIKIKSMLGLSAFALFSFMFFIFSLDGQTREVWNIKVLSRKQASVFLPPAIIHSFLALLPLLVYLLI